MRVESIQVKPDSIGFPHLDAKIGAATYLVPPTKSPTGAAAGGSSAGGTTTTPPTSQSAASGASVPTATVTTGATR
jgi:hypothetical protein